MKLKCGIVGLPNVGKSTLFNALTNATIPAENYPFCTIDPHLGGVAVPDIRLQQIADIVKPEKIVPTLMEFVDIAGLVKGAANGEGLGNKFLAHIRETDAIAMVTRCFINDDITHVAGKVSPIDDIETIQTELALADLESVGRALQKASKNTKSGDKTAKFEADLLTRLSQHLDQNQPVRIFPFENDDERDFVKKLFLLTAKPILYIANVDEQGFKNNPLLDAVANYAEKQGADLVPICAAIEAELAVLPDEEKIEFLSEMGLSEPGLNRVIRAAYHLLGLQTYFTAGVKEVRAWTVKQGSTAPQCAGEIHSDFEKGFIRAEVIAFDDFIQCGGEQGAKAAGLLRVEGKDYIAKDGDVMHFRFNV